MRSSKNYLTNLLKRSKNSFFQSQEERRISQYFYYFHYVIRFEIYHTQWLQYERLRRLYCKPYEVVRRMKKASFTKKSQFDP